MSEEWLTDGRRWFQEFFHENFEGALFIYKYDTEPLKESWGHAINDVIKTQALLLTKLLAKRHENRVRSWHIPVHSLL